MRFRLNIFILTFAVLTTILFLSSVPFLPTSAQGNTSDCKPADLFPQLATLKSAGDPDKDLAALTDLSSQIRAQNIACKGQVFKGKGSKIIGPIIIPDGLFRVIVESPSFIASGKVSDGKCGQGTVSPTSVFSIYTSTDNGVGRAETLVKSQACKLLIDISASAAWTVTIEPIQ